AHKLVTSNLRFVVKVAYEYRSYGIKMADLIQEGNIGLMKAVQKFDADKGIRLISYAVWWIRAFIQNYILKSWSLVKLGTTQEERHIVQERVLEALSRLDPRERYIIEMRVMQDKPMTLKELGEHFGFSRERARQLEIRAKAKLEAELGELMEDLFPGEERLPV